MSKHYAFSFNSERCLKCWSCEVACQQWHGIKAGTVKLRRVTEATEGVFPDITRKFFSVSCRHCSVAPCALACPTAAISKRTEDGIVVVDSTLCNGCRACFDACPDKIPEFGPDGIMQKCDMCLDRLEAGQNPICVAACPTMALQWRIDE